ncbi:MAG: UDP-N-acetylmuramoyl-L-alanyl-D-glutamate--2,6-diaminopimelate ligase [Candidatus Saccharimonadales bacterium]
MNIRKIVKAVIPVELFRVIEPTGHLLEAVLWNCVYGFPGRGLKVIGVTGTNGKTTTSYLIYRMLSEAGLKAGLVTTVAYGIGGDIRPKAAHVTNTPPRELMQLLKQMKAEGVEWVVLETTSHGLAQHRVWGVPYSIAVLTNITHEHLDYHKTFERYVAAKRRLFEITQRNKNGLQLGIANIDDQNGPSFAAVTRNSMLYGMNAGGLRAHNVKLTSDGVRYTAKAMDENYDIVCHIPGSFNVYNSLAAVCVGRAVGLSKSQIEKGIAALEGVEGRMTTIDEGQDFSVIVDFAHTPDSFEKLFKDMRPVVKGKLIVLFGSAGRRDVPKRAIQGELAGKYADEVIITEEDDRDVPGAEIMNQIAEGAEKAGKTRDKDLFLIGDRTEAIKFAISRANNKADTVLLLGKGHEKTIERADGEHPWNEITTVHTALKNRSI